MSRAPLPQSFKCAWAGVVQAFRGGRNFKIQLAFAVVAVILGFALAIDSTQWAVVWVCIGVVLGGECMNTALEAAVDLASESYHDLAKQAKDCAAGAVLIASVASLFVAAFVFLPPIARLLFP